LRLAPDETQPLFRLLLGLGVIGILILAVGLAQFVTFEPSGQRTGQVARITGVYDWDRESHGVTGPNKDHFRTDEPFAAVVDWSALPPTMLVGAGWFSSGFAVNAGSVGPHFAGQLVSLPAVPVNTGDLRFPSGHYQFVVERYSKGIPVEVLARKTVLVLGG
jgi:hypothetical protein